MENEVTVLQYQSLLDICLQTTGNIEGILELAMKNGMSCSDLPQAGTKVIPIDKETGDRRILEYYKANGIRPATGYQISEDAEQLEGIGYWFINADFIVQ